MTAYSGPFVKLFSSIIHSTIWRAPSATRLVWITMLAISDRRGYVAASVPGLADAARVSLSECEDAIRELSSPDRWSSSTDHQGRRIATVDGGWLVLNYMKFRNTQDRDAYLERNRVKVAAHRARRRVVTDVTGNRPVTDVKPVVDFVDVVMPEEDVGGPLTRPPCPPTQHDQAVKPTFCTIASKSSGSQRAEPDPSPARSMAVPPVRRVRTARPGTEHREPLMRAWERGMLEHQGSLAGVSRGNKLAIAAVDECLAAASGELSVAVELVGAYTQLRDGWVEEHGWHLRWLPDRLPKLCVLRARSSETPAQASAREAEELRRLGMDVIGGDE